MIPGTTLPTPDENRLKLVQDTMTMYSVLDDYAAGKHAVQVLHALESIPEKIAEQRRSSVAADGSHLSMTTWIPLAQRKLRLR
jgi:Family of unknown function (DUF6307)